VAYENGYVISDGMTRFVAAKSANLETIPARLIASDDPLKSAYEHSLCMAVRSAKPLSFPERVRAIRALRKLHPDWSARKIARTVGVNHKTVLKYENNEDHKKGASQPLNGFTKVRRFLNACASLYSTGELTTENFNAWIDLQEDEDAATDVLWELRNVVDNLFE
jgi:transcriptional regulator with XRE-family HTH domain